MNEENLLRNKTKVLIIENLLNGKAVRIRNYVYKMVDFIRTVDGKLQCCNKELRKLFVDQLVGDRNINTSCGYVAVWCNILDDDFPIDDIHIYENCDRFVIDINQLNSKTEC